MLALLGAHNILHVSRMRFNSVGVLVVCPRVKFHAPSSSGSLHNAVKTVTKEKYRTVSIPLLYILSMKKIQQKFRILGSFTLHFGLKYEIIYQLDAIEYLCVFFQLDMFRAYTPIFRSNGCFNFFTYAAYGVLGVVRCRS